MIGIHDNLRHTLRSPNSRGPATGGPISGGMCITPSFVVPSGTDNAAVGATPYACCLTVADGEQPLALMRHPSFDTEAIS
jgi:hypothetical protein